MNFTSPLEPAKLVKRYKRFLADVIHPQLGKITVHCPNTGSMRNCWQPGWTVWLQKSNNPKRKYAYTWVLSENEDGNYIGINTHLANKLVYEAILERKIPEFSDYVTIEKEVKYGEENSRIDILLSDQTTKKTFIEVKSVTLLESDGLGYFPDAVTLRGQKHIRELIHCHQNGHRSVLFFMVQHTGIKKVKVAEHIDPVYASLLEEAMEVGVEVLVYDSLISPRQITLNRPLRFIS